MTEDEAKTKWCPFARVGSEKTGIGSINRDWAIVEKTMAANCIGSTCMAWRWRMVANPEWQPENPMALYPARNHYSATPQGVPSKTDGYCGLAGVSS